MAVRGKLDFGGELSGQPLLTARNDGAEQVLEGPAAGQEQGGRSLISSDPLPPGTVYTAGIRTDGTVGLSGGAGKLKMAGGAAGTIKESIQRASYVYAKKNDLGLARDLDTSDFHVQVLDLLNNHVQAEVGVAFFIACYSAIRKAPVSAAMLILGDMSVQGNIKALPSLVEPLQLAMDNGAKRAFIPLGNKRNFFEVKQTSSSMWTQYSSATRAKSSRARAKAVRPRQPNR